MADVRIDHVSQLNAQERDGIIVRLVRRARVVNLESTDYTVLYAALTSLGLVPQSKLTEPGFTNLVLRERNPTLVDEDKGTVDVELIYEHEANNSGQIFANPTSGVVIGQVQSCVGQKRSNLDINGEVVTVTHTYPATDKDYKNEEQEQGGAFDFLQPQSRRIYKGRLATQQPALIEAAIIGTINLSPWQGGAPGTWMCSAADWEPAAASAFLYDFVFEFQHDPDGWNPTVTFLDKRTGAPPAGLVEGEGWKVIQKYREVSFEAITGTRFAGG